MKNFDKSTFENIILKINLIFITLLGSIICGFVLYYAQKPIILKVFNIIDIILNCLTIFLILITIFPFTEYLEWVYNKLNEKEDK